MDSYVEKNDYLSRQMESQESRLGQLESTLSEFHQMLAKQSLLIERLSQAYPPFQYQNQQQNHFQEQHMHSKDSQINIHEQQQQSFGNHHSQSVAGTGFVMPSLISGYLIIFLQSN